VAGNALIGSPILALHRRFRYNRAFHATCLPWDRESTGKGTRVSFTQRLQEVRDGFEPAFWVANVSEIFERLAYYGAFSSLANYLHESLNIPTEQTGSLTGLFGGMVWFLAILGGAVADRLGFRRALSLAYLILSCAYFLLGSLGAAWMAPVRTAVPLTGLLAFVLILPALGIAMVKPSVVGTTARASSEKVRSIGYSIYYTLVNIGGAAGPYVASWAHRRLGVENVFRVSALSVLLMFFAVLLFFKEPRRSGEAEAPRLAEVARNLFIVITNARFMLFLLIFSGYWIVFWQQYIALPIYVHAYIDPHADVELILVTDAATVICLQFIVTYLTRKIPAFRAITIGTLISALGWLIVASRPAVWAVVMSLLIVALGEIVLSPRYYEYISRLAPPGQQGTYMGFAFLPIGIGSLAGGWLGGRLMHHYGEVVGHPAQVWWAFTGIGIGTTALMRIYHSFVQTNLPTAEANRTI
jgi:proton-dependent oligopeptide transporter, POT family